jgi:hypothetical protein
MTTHRFARLDSADSFLAAVCDTVRRRTAAAAPTDAERERSARMLVRAVKHRDRAAADLVRAGLPEGVVATRLADRAEDRARASRRVPARAGRR